MAAIIRQSARLLSRTIAQNSFRAGSSAAKNPDDTFKRVEKEVQTSTEGFYSELTSQKIEGVKAMNAQDLLQELGSVTGQQRSEMLDAFRGVTDPFDLSVHKQARENDGTKEYPILVPTTSGERLVGCICEEDISEVNWMILYSGIKKQCNCGNWFQAVQIPGAHDH